MLYISALSSSASTIVLGLLALYFRLLSVSSLIVSAISAGLLLAAAVMATVVYNGLVTAFDTGLRSSGIHVSLGAGAIKLMWSAFSTSFLATCLWLVVSICCCCL